LVAATPLCASVVNPSPLRELEDSSLTVDARLRCDRAPIRALPLARQVFRLLHAFYEPCPRKIFRPVGAIVADTLCSAALGALLQFD
jgi:hypothetical protein